MCNFVMQQCQKKKKKKKKHFYLGPSIILFSEDTKLWMIHLDILEIFVPLQLKKKQQVYVLQEDDELCPFLLFPSNYTHCSIGKGKLSL